MNKNQIVPKLIQANLNTIEEEVLAQLPNATYALAKGASDAMGATAEALFDELEPNGPQVEEIWKAYVNEIVIDFAKTKADSEVDKIKSEIIRNLLTTLLAPGADTLKALTDGVTDDGTQIKRVWVDYLKTGQNLDVILGNTLKPLLLLVIKQEVVVDSLVSLIALQLKTLIK